MPKFFKKDKKTEEEVSTSNNKVEKPVESAATVDDWMNYPSAEPKSSSKKKITSEKEKKAAAYEERETENSALIQSLQQENKTLQSHVDELENNFNRIVDLQNEVQSLKTLLDERDSLHDELMQVTDQLHETQRFLEQTQLSSTQNKTSSDKLQVQLKDLTQQLQDEKVKGQNYQKDIETLQEKNRQWEADHKQLKSKTEILLKERARILAGGKQITDIEKMLDEYADLIAEVETLQAQKKRLNEDLVMTTQKLAITATSGPHPPISSLVAAKDHGSDALKHALAQKVELERLVADMTETVKSKETQMATIKDVNRQLAEQLQAYRSKYEGDTEELI